jgi:hypothetical protein
VDWVHLGQERDNWEGLVNAVMNVGFHKMRRTSWLAKSNSYIWLVNDSYAYWLANATEFYS